MGEVVIPCEIGILPFKNKVLLPGAIIRIRCTSPSSVKLVEEELWQREEKGVIGILPLVDRRRRRSSNNQQEPLLLQWHTRGVAARALHLSRGVEKPSGRVSYTLVLEGLCRFRVLEPLNTSSYSTATISPLHITNAEMERLQQDPDYIALSRHFKFTAMDLISLLEQTRQRQVGFEAMIYKVLSPSKLKPNPLAL